MKRFVFLFMSIITCISVTPGYTCTRILNANNPDAVILGRTMDWEGDLYTNIWVYPEGVKRNGQVQTNPLEWQSHYGSIVTTAFDMTGTDGINEKGLAAHILWLGETDYGNRDEKQKGLSVTQWLQYYLDNFSSVNEAVDATRAPDFQVVGMVDPNTHKKIQLHLALEDASGDSAIIEYIGGKPKIYHGAEYSVLTNSPTLPKQLKHLKQYKGFGGNKPLPGTTDATDRFVRAAYYLKFMPKANSAQEAMAQTMSIVRSIAEPYGDPVKTGEDVSPTIWQTITNLSDLTYYFNDSRQMNFIWTNLHNFNLSTGSPILKLDLVNHPNLSGDVTKFFQPM